MSPLLWAFAAWVFVSSLLLGAFRWGRFSVRRAAFPGRAGRGDPTLLWALRFGLPIAAGGAGLVGFGHPGLGLVGALAFPVGAAAALRWRRGRRAREWEDSAVAFLFGLQGLLRAGLSLPAALVRLGDREGGEFSARLARSLARFEGGRPLSDCLESAGRGEGGPAALCLGILASGYRQGVPVVPFLDRILPWLEEERRLRLRTDEIRHSAFAQAAAAAVLPWAVAWFAAGSPASWAPSARGAAVGALFLQALGFWGVKRWCTYE